MERSKLEKLKLPETVNTILPDEDDREILKIALAAPTQEKVLVLTVDSAFFQGDLLVCLGRTLPKIGRKIEIKKPSEFLGDARLI